MSIIDRSTKYRALIILVNALGDKIPLLGLPQMWKTWAEMNCVFPRGVRGNDGRWLMHPVDGIEEHLRAGWLVSDESHAVPVAGPDYAVDTKQVDAILDSLARHDGREASMSGVN